MRFGLLFDFQSSENFLYTPDTKRNLMPRFEYTCQKFGSAFEALPTNAAAITACNSCRSKQVEKQLSTFAQALLAVPLPLAPMACPSIGMVGTDCSGGGYPLS
jgi:putative FmdB family regulatory protein